MKVANLRLLQERPGAAALATYNAESNAHMVAVNDALGSYPSSGSASSSGPCPTGDASGSRGSPLASRRWDQDFEPPPSESRVIVAVFSLPLWVQVTVTLSPGR